MRRTTLLSTAAAPAALLLAAAPAVAQNMPKGDAQNSGMVCEDQRAAIADDAEMQDRIAEADAGTREIVRSYVDAAARLDAAGYDAACAALMESVRDMTGRGDVRSANFKRNPDDTVGDPIATDAAEAKTGVQDTAERAETDVTERINNGADPSAPSENAAGRRDDQDQVGGTVGTPGEPAYDSAASGDSPRAPMTTDPEGRLRTGTAGGFEETDYTASAEGAEPWSDIRGMFDSREIVGAEVMDMSGEEVGVIESFKTGEQGRIRQVVIEEGGIFDFDSETKTVPVSELRYSEDAQAFYVNRDAV